MSMIADYLVENWASFTFVTEMIGLLIRKKMTAYNRSISVDYVGLIVSHLDGYSNRVSG